MTHWTKITSQTRHFTDESYMRLSTPDFQLYTPAQKARMEAERIKKVEDEKARRRRDMEESRRSKTL